MANYGTIYTLPFQSIKGIDYIVEIQKENYTGRSIELKGSGDAPFSVELADEDFLYNPTRFSVATIRVIGNDYLQSLYSTGYQQYRVNFKRDTIVVWTGFVTPELYTQDYTSTLFDLEIQCVSAMSTLEYIKYKQVGEKRAFVSLWDLLKKCITESRGSYSSVYVPHVYAKSASLYNTTENVLQGMTVSEQDFFDEDDEAMTLKEVLEEICKLLSWTCVDYRGELFFVDVDHKGIYRKYSSDLSDYEAVTPGTLKVQDIGFSGSDHTLDILGGYNKAVVKVSNYGFKQVFPEEDYNKLKEFSGIMEATVKNKVSAKQFFYNDVYKLYQYGYGLDGTWKALTPHELELLYKNSPNSTANDIVGAMLVKRCDYNIVNDKPDITNYNWENIIQVRSYKDDEHKTTGSLILEFANPLPVAPYSDGAIIISMSLQVTMNTDMTIGYVKQSGWLDMRCVLSIGDNYYNGKEWINDPSAAFDIEFMLKDYDGRSFINNVNTKTLSMPYDGANGLVIELPKDRVLVGAANFRLYQLSENYKHNNTGALDEVHGTANRGRGYFIKDLKMNYQVRDKLNDLENNSDRYYENVVNESYVNPADEIEFKISSYNNDGACYSKVMLGDNYLTDNLYSAIEGKPIRPEEGLIRRIVNQYSATKNKLTQVLVYSDSVTPITAITDKFQPDKRFVLTGGEIDFAAESFTIKMVQNGN